MLKSDESLSQQVARGGVWVFTLRIIEEGLGFIRLVILARLLAPNDFGLFGIVLLAMSTLETFSQTGFQTALIQKKGDISRYLDTAWTASAIRGIILFVILFFSAPYVAFFFNTTEASLIKIIGFSILLGGFTNIGIIYFQKELKFNKQFIYGIATTLADFIVAVSAALIYKNVWALVLGQLAGSFTGVVVSYLIHPYRAHFILDLTKIKELFRFGKWIFGSSILAFLITQGDDIFVGKMLGVVSLGFYQMAYSISNIPATKITRVISSVTFPAYSKMQDDLPRLREAFLRVLQLTAFLSFPVAGLIFVLAPDFTKIFLGEKWMPMVSSMQVLALWGLIRSIGSTIGPVFHAVGNPKILTKYQLFQLFMLIILIYPLTMRWGILGTSLAVLFASMVPNGLSFYAAIKITKCELNDFFEKINFPLICSLLAMVSIFLLHAYFATQNLLLISFILSMIIYLLVYFGATYLFNRFSKYKIYPLVQEVFLTFRGP